MTAKHTPGPWVLEVDEDEGVIRLRMGTALDEDAFAWDAPHLIELEFDPTARKTWEEAIANMRLMSAAPDLLAAAEAALNHLERLELRGILVSEAVIEALSYAIAKARGEGLR